MRLVRRRPWHYAGGITSVILLDAIDMLPALIIRRVTDEAQKNPHAIDVGQYALMLVGCYLAISFLRLAWRFLLMMPSRTMEKELRQEAFDKLLHGDFARASRLKIGDVVSTLSQDIGNIRMFMGPGILVLFDSMAYLIFIPATLFYILGFGALWVLIPFVGLTVAVLVVHRPLERGYKSLSDRIGDLSQYVFEEAQGARFFRAEGLIEVRRKRYEILLSGLTKNTLGFTKWELGLDGTLQTVIQTSYLMVLALAYSGEGAMAQGLGTLTISLQLLDKLLWPLMSMSYLMNLYQQARAGSVRFEAINELPHKAQGRVMLEAPLREVQLENISARTSEGKTLLHEISLTLKAGEQVAFVGKVGAGKSVLLQTLAGLWEPDALSFSRFTFDGASYHQLDRRSLWRQLSYIPQTPQIFSKSLAMNISPHHPLEPGRLWEALERADLSQDVTLFPEGLSTLVGEKGMNLSGGQKQRTLIARSFHSGARLYLWDDAISALDPVTERRVISSLKRLDPEAILVLATHRLSSLKDFDRIFVIEEGRIVRSGTLDEIKRDHALFATLLRYEEEQEKEKHGTADSAR
jgi:ATP-binding cassette subfamily B protein